MTYVPVDEDVTDRVEPVAASVALIFAPITTAPAWSNTVPVIWLVSVCAIRVVAPKPAKNKAPKKNAGLDLVEICKEFPIFDSSSVLQRKGREGSNRSRIAIIRYASLMPRG